MKRKIATIAVIMGLHFGLTFMLFMMDFSAGMSRFDAGSDPTIREKTLHVAAMVMMWPIFDPLVKWGGRLVGMVFPGILGYIPMLANSLIWGIVGWMIIAKLRTKRKGNRTTAST